MLTEAAQYRMAEKVNRFIRQTAQVAGYTAKEEVLNLFDSMLKLMPHWVIMTCPASHQNIRYISRNTDQILGYNADYLKQSRGLENWFGFVHDADKDELHDCFGFLFNYLASVPVEMHCQMRCVFHYRFKKQNGQIIYLHDEKAVLNLNESGNLYYVLMRDITEERKFSGVKLEIFRQDLPMTKITEFKPSAGTNSLTNRESELVTLIKRGLSTKEIAWYLKISHHTVRNIKSRLFEKFNVNNSIELLNMTA